MCGFEVFARVGAKAVLSSANVLAGGASHTAAIRHGSYHESVRWLGGIETSKIIDARDLACVWHDTLDSATRC